MTMITIFQAPEKSEPVLADKEIIMAALNIKSMNFGSNFLVGNIDEDKGIFNDNRFDDLHNFLKYCQGSLPGFQYCWTWHSPLMFATLMRPKCT